MWHLASDTSPLSGGSGIWWKGERDLSENKGESPVQGRKCPRGECNQIMTTFKTIIVTNGSSNCVFLFGGGGGGTPGSATATASIGQSLFDILHFKLKEVI